MSLSSLRAVVISSLLLSPLLFFSPACSSQSGNEAAYSPEACPGGEAIETDGHRRLALILGVGTYRNQDIPELRGAPADARRMYELLTGPGGYEFPPENVCMLLNEQATTENFKAAFESALVRRAQPEDVVVIFYAGHGSRTPDKNGDEPDEWDETFVFHDARSEGVRDLVDDEFNQLLAELHQKTRNITVILDSCNSGTATRGEPGSYQVRYQPPAKEPPGPTSGPSARGDQASGWLPKGLPGLVVFTAASDGTSALEQDGSGIFTDALIRVLAGASASSRTYAQVARQVPPLVAARSYQIPYFQGALEKTVFGNARRSRPYAWEVIETAAQIKLGGPPLPGMGPGAELRIFDGSTEGTATRDPSQAKATVVVESMTGLNATARIVASDADAAEIEAGDLAILARPADQYLRIRLRLRPAGETQGLSAQKARQLRRAIQSDPETRMLVEMVDSRGDFEIALTGDDKLQLRGPENRIRNEYASDQVREVTRSLWQHARQKALLQLRGEGGADFQDNETLQVQLIPAPPARQSSCADGEWIQSDPNQEQVIPLCHAWNVQVQVSEKAPMPLLVGGVILSTDGSLFGFPFDGRTVKLNPGESYVFGQNQETFIGTIPLDVRDHVLVFGTQETNPVPWHLLTETSVTRAGVDSARGGLYRALDLYLRPGTRGAARREVVEDTTWTMSTVGMRVEANSRFLSARDGSDQPRRREYTIPNFDIRPYLPDDSSTALYKVLARADELAKRSAQDGVPYKQHDWSKSSDEANLELGIDCSRSIWFAFTRSELPYNQEDRYLNTEMMVGNNSLMADEFQSCNDDPQLKLGDILVYRDEGRQVGHVIMVIDPEKRIAWGSHGWDGNPKFGLPADTGVEYQLIKYKQDWERWDRATMQRRACWRYRDFAQEAASGQGQPGISAMANICNPGVSCGL